MDLVVVWIGQNDLISGAVKPGDIAAGQVAGSLRLVSDQYGARDAACPISTG